MLNKTLREFLLPYTEAQRPEVGAEIWQGMRSAMTNLCARRCSSWSCCTARCACRRPLGRSVSPLQSSGKPCSPCDHSRQPDSHLAAAIVMKPCRPFTSAAETCLGHIAIGPTQSLRAFRMPRC